MSKQKILILCSLIILIPLGLGSKIYTGMGENWINNYLGGVIYEIFWCLFFFWFFPRKQNIILIPVLVLIITSLIEILQLWKNPFLETIRKFTIGKLLLGTTFSWWDFPHYLLGCVLGFIWLYLINNQFKISS